MTVIKLASTATATGTPVAGRAEAAEREARDGLGLTATGGIAKTGVQSSDVRAR